LHDEIYIKANKNCDCDTITLVISVNRPTFVSPVTTTTLDIPWVEVIFFNWENWPATVLVLYWPEILQIIFWYFSYICAAQLNRGVFHLGISYTWWLRGIRVPVCFLWSLFSLYQGCWRTRRLWIRSFHNWRYRRQGTRGYQQVECRNTLGGLFSKSSHLGLFSSTAQITGFLEYQHPV